MQRKQKKLLDKRKKEIVKKNKDFKRIVFVNKNDGSKYMVSNMKTMQKIDAKEDKISAF